MTADVNNGLKPFKNKILIAPSILSADFSRMGEEVARIERAGADLIHCDVMDGVFVPNITFGLKMIADIKKSAVLPLDVHLMIVEPEKYIKRFIEAGADILTVHYEACKNAIDALKQIRDLGVKAGIVISPDTPVSVLKGLLQYCELALLMSVYPGFGGQKFIENSIGRLKELKSLAAAENPNILIEIDGGISLETAAAVLEAGANVLVAGNAVFSATDTSATITALRNAARAKK
jgi:ribulose-phosphate 3-epimerase